MAETVIVGCKLPNGVILELGEKQILINGLNTSRIIGGHGITENVPKDFFDAWMEKNKELSFVKGGFIFAHGKQTEVAAQAKDKESVATGLEPLDPAKAPSGIKVAKKDED